MSDRSEIIEVFGEEVAASVDTPLVVIEGTKGDPGAPGKDGVSPTVSTAATTGGTKVTITDAKGSHEFVVKDGAKGADGSNGKDGVSPTVSTAATTGGTKVTITDAKGSHEFVVKDGAKGADGSNGKDGTNGKDGADGKPGASGADGITPHIGDNGHWYLGTTDTGKPSRGATGPKGDPGTPGAAGAPGKDGAGMDITGATVGQIAKITAVDASGVPTAWSPADMPSGGGSGAVRYDAAQSLTFEQKQQARKNIEALPVAGAVTAGVVSMCPDFHIVDSNAAVHIVPSKVNDGDYTITLDCGPENALVRVAGIRTPTDAQTNYAANVAYVKAKIAAIGAGAALPSVTAADNGKILRVVDGAWAAASLPVYNGGVS